MACSLGTIVGSAGASAQERVDSGFTTQDVVDRNELIAAQETLLNVYRCRFNVDTQVVPDGCVDGQPAGGPTEPDPFEGNPTENDITVRDQLIIAQESLLNNYRCLFKSDLRVMDDDGTNGVQLAKVAGQRAYSWSPDGTRIAFSNGPTNDIWVANADGTNKRRLAGIDAEYGPIWSPTR